MCYVFYYLFIFFSKGAQVKEFCAHGTKDECRRVWMSESEDGPESKWNCHRLHFRKIIQPHTDESLGDCSFLNTCFHMETCKYVSSLHNLCSLERNLSCN